VENLTKLKMSIELTKRYKESRISPVHYLKENSMPLILTMGGLLEALAFDVKISPSKTVAKIFHNPPHTIEVQEFFDDGAGHSNPDSLIQTGLDRKIFDLALKRKYIQPMEFQGGYSSKEFEITKIGRDEFLKIKELNK
jgi:hypothetical protein